VGEFSADQLGMSRANTPRFTTGMLVVDDDSILSVEFAQANLEEWKAMAGGQTPSQL
jgi:hypothetical protein